MVEPCLSHSQDNYGDEIKISFSNKGDGLAKIKSVKFYNKEGKEINIKLFMKYLKTKPDAVGESFIVSHLNANSLLRAGEETAWFSFKLLNKKSKLIVEELIKELEILHVYIDYSDKYDKQYEYKAKIKFLKQ